MKYYIGCAQANHGKVAALHTKLDSIGHTCIYDWWNDKDADKESFEASFNRVQALEGAELFICLLPLTRNTAIEFGISLASRYGKRIILWSASASDFDSEYANINFYHPSVTQMVCSFEKLLEYVATL